MSYLYKKVLLVLLVTAVWPPVFAQHYSVFVTDSVNMYQYPHEDSASVKELLPQELLFCYCDSAINGFYRVIDIASDNEGYVSSGSFQRGKIIPENQRAMFSPEGELNQREPILTVINGTDTTISLRLNDTVYKLSPKEEKVLVLEPGKYRYVASAPGVIPMHGVDELKEYLRYRWRFFVKYPD